MSSQNEKTTPSPSGTKGDKSPTGNSREEVTSTVTVKNVEEIPKPVSVLQMFRYATTFERALNVVGLIFAIAAGTAQPLMTLLFGNLTNAFVDFGTALEAINQGRLDPSALVPLADRFKDLAAENSLYLTVIGIGMFAATFTYSYFYVYTSESIAKRVRERYLRAILRQDIAYFDKVGAGEVATRIQTDTHLLQRGISEKVPILCTFISAFITGFVLAYARLWRLALALSSILPVIAVASIFFDYYGARYIEQTLTHVAAGGTVAEEVISTVRTAHAFGTQQILAGLYDGHNHLALVAEMRSAVVMGIGLAIVFFASYSAYALAFSFGTTLIIRGHADVGTVVNCFMSILIGTFMLAMLPPESQAIIKGQAAAAKLFHTIDRVPDIDSEDPSGHKPETVSGKISFSHVNFTYPARPEVQVLKDFTIQFPAKKTCALVGASGSGKSTIVSLIERFYDVTPDGGVIELDGVPLKDLNLKWLRSKIGLVSQEPVLFSTSIKNNVAHGLIGSQCQDVSQEEKDKLIKEACVKANADSFISRLPDGYDTVVGERGFLLSGGQKQRVAIARAIVSDPRILLLDEATSALDTASEAIVQDALDKAAAGRTTIMIAHRLSTVKGADCIYVMGSGQLLQQGTHAELLRDTEGPYAKLVQAQKLKEEKEKTGPEAQGSKVDTPGLHVHISQEVPTVVKDPHDDFVLKRQGTQHSLASELLEKRNAQEAGYGKKASGYGTIDLVKRLGSLQKGVWKEYLWGGILAIVVGAIYPAFSIVFSLAVTAFQTNDNRQLRKEGDRNALWFFIISLISMVAIGLQQYAFGVTAANLTYKLRSVSFRAILRQDIKFFDDDKHGTGSLTSKLSDNPQKISGLAGATLAAIIQAISTIVVGWIIGLIYQWKLSLIGIAVTPVLISAGYIRLRVVVTKDEKNKVSHETSAQLACEAAGAIRTVASLTREKDCSDNYANSLVQPLRLSLRTAIFSNLLYAISQACVFFAIALVFWIGANDVADQEYGTSEFFVAVFAVTFGAIQAGDVFNWVPDVSSARSASVDLLTLIDSHPEIDAQSHEGHLPNNIQGHIRFESVHFRYPTRPAVRVLRGLDLTIEPGSFVALVGTSGCGKSTIIQLVERFYDPLIGKIYIDGQDISQMNVQEYRKHIALVSQEPTLYAGTIYFNVLLGATKKHEDVTQEEIETACRDANILDFINSLPNGFDTEVGGKGSQLSGGQKQRIAIARALIRNPKVLLLDEATSALDSESEKVVQTALDQASKGRTTIAIAHRLSTIQNADCIYFVNDGQISESGTHEQLLAQRGGYYEFVQSQALSAPT